MKKIEFKTEFDKLTATYLNTDIKDATVKIYWEMFKDCDATDFKRAVYQAIKEEEFFPRVATLFSIMERDVFVPSEADVMNDLRARIDGCGIYESPEFRYPMTQAIVEELNWQTICNMPPENLNEAVHWRYPAVENHYRNSLRYGEPFPVNRIKGLFELQGRVAKVINGKVLWIKGKSVQESGSDEIKSLKDILKLPEEPE